jgi:TorA maturation chaperone TorD
MSREKEAVMNNLSQANNLEAPETAQANPPLSEEQQYRAGAYGLLAALLRVAPDAATLQQLAGFAQLQSTANELSVAMSMLGLAASSSSPEPVGEEFHDLFIGLGRGELVPYGSWYLTGFLMERPLARLRRDLTRLGFQREEEVHEPEDHVAALCEVMQMLIGSGCELDEQQAFFETHIGSWFEGFFSDLSNAKTAVFYRAVGRFGAAFTALEQRYLSMQV